MLDRLHRPYSAHGCQRFRASRRHGCTRCLGDGHVGAVGELCVDLGLRLIGGVEGRRGTGEGHRQCQEHDRAGKRCPLPGKGVGENARQRTGNRCQQDGHRATAPHQDQVGQPPDEQRTADPQQRRGDERPVGDRNRGHAFWGEDDLVPRATGQPEQQPRSGEQHDVDAEAGPSWGSGPPDLDACVGDGDAAEVSPRRHQHGCCGDRQADGDGRHCPADRGGGVCPEARGPEADQADQRRRSQTRGTAEDADHDRLGRREPDQPAGGRAPGAEQCLLAAPPRGSRVDHRRGQQRRHDGCGQTEEEEEHAGVGGITAGGVERGGKVVTDQRGAGTACFEVVRGGGDLGVGGGRIVRQCMVECGVDLGADQIGAGSCQWVEDVVPPCFVENQDVVRWRGRLCARRRADLLEQRVRLREIHHAVDDDVDCLHSGPRDGDRVARSRIEVGCGLLGDEHATIGAGKGAHHGGPGVAVGRRDPQYRCGTGRSDASRPGRAEPGRLGEPDRRCRHHVGGGPHGVQHVGCRAVRLYFDLPVDGDCTRRAGGHGALGSGQETAQAGEQRHRRRDARCGAEESAWPAADQAERPRRDHGAIGPGVAAVSRWPSRIVQRSVSRAATSGSWVAIIRAAPMMVAVSSSAVMTRSALS